VNVVTTTSIGEKGAQRALLAADAATLGPGRRRSKRWRRYAGWLFALPALLFYGIFELHPIISAVNYSFYKWDGISAVKKWVGLSNYVAALTQPQQLSSLVHAFVFIIFFTVLPVTFGLIVASVMRTVKPGPYGTVTRTLVFLPQILPGAAAGVAWNWMYSKDGFVNTVLHWVGLGSLARGWVGSFTFALPAVGFVGTWLSTGLCSVLLMAGIGSINPSLYEAAKVDGAGIWHQFRQVTLPGLRQQIGVCVTITVIAALSSFDVVYLMTQGGPGYSTVVPGVEVYNLAFNDYQIGSACALAVVLAVIVIAVVAPLQRFFRGTDNG
jgi:raffinose/stachyose/melibiose transport system permease protein